MSGGGPASLAAGTAGRLASGGGVPGARAAKRPCQAGEKAVAFRGVRTAAPVVVRAAPRAVVPGRLGQARQGGVRLVCL